MPTSSPWFLRSPFCVEAVVERKRADAATAAPSSPEELELSWVTVQVRQRERAAAAPARPPPRSSALSKRADRPWAPQSRVEEGKWGRSWRRSERSCIFATPPAPNCSKEFFSPFGTAPAKTVRGAVGGAVPNAPSVEDKGQHCTCKPM